MDRVVMTEQMSLDGWKMEWAKVGVGNSNIHTTIVSTEKSTDIKHSTSYSKFQFQFVVFL